MAVRERNVNKNRQVYALTASVRAGPATGGSQFYFIGFYWNGQSTVDSYKEFSIVTRAKGPSP
jgi:hypothetical protein